MVLQPDDYSSLLGSLYFSLGFEGWWVCLAIPHPGLGQEKVELGSGAGGVVGYIHVLCGLPGICESQQCGPGCVPGVCEP